MHYILSIDQSTSGTKALLFEETGRLCCRTDLPHRQMIGENGWVEHDPEEIYQNVLRCVRAVLNQSGANPKEICAVGISNQRETALVWNRRTGKPLCNAVVWQCPRGEGICRELESQGWAEKIKTVTGLHLSPYFSAAKISWILRHARKPEDRLEELCAGTIDSWLVWKLTGEFRTDYSNASRTQLLNLRTLQWDPEICAAFGINPSMLPSICFSDSEFGRTDFEGILPQKVPVCGVLGDSHAALFGQGCLQYGTGKVTYGTGSSVMIHTGEELVTSSDGLVTSLAWGMQGKVSYVLEGNINYTGAVIKWLVEDVELLSSSRESGEVAQTVESTEGVYLVPAFSGLGAPYWDSGARAVLWGMNRKTKRAHIVRAAEESIAYQILDIVSLVQKKVALQTLNGDGGPAKDAFLMQFQADMLGLPVQVPVLEELSGAGAAYAAGISCGMYEMQNLLRQREQRVYCPQMSSRRREELYSGWKTAVNSILTQNR